MVRHKHWLRDVVLRINHHLPTITRRRGCNRRRCELHDGIIRVNRVGLLLDDNRLLLNNDWPLLNNDWLLLNNDGLLLNELWQWCVIIWTGVVRGR